MRLCLRVLAWARMRMRALVRAGVRACVCVRAFIYTCMIYHIGLANMIQPS